MKRETASSSYSRMAGDCRDAVLVQEVIGSCLRVSSTERIGFLRDFRAIMDKAVLTAQEGGTGGGAPPASRRASARSGAGRAGTAAPTTHSVGPAIANAPAVNDAAWRRGGTSSRQAGAELPDQQPKRPAMAPSISRPQALSSAMPRALQHPRLPCRPSAHSLGSRPQPLASTLFGDSAGRSARRAGRWNDGHRARLGWGLLHPRIHGGWAQRAIGLRQTRAESLVGIPAMRLVGSDHLGRDRRDRGARRRPRHSSRCRGCRSAWKKDPV